MTGETGRPGWREVLGVFLRLGLTRLRGTGGARRRVRPAFAP
ncbi:MAG TPA: hypothetical protein VFK38_10785 [Candidatus Limnocylindrales bacterium]|nr:hypothetical protein [Candidatus Limnocylindrales bacterium]